MARCIVLHEAIVHFLFFCKLCEEITVYNGHKLLFDLERGVA